MGLPGTLRTLNRTKAAVAAYDKATKMMEAEILIWLYSTKSTLLYATITSTLMRSSRGSNHALITPV